MTLIEVHPSVVQPGGGPDLGSKPQHCRARARVVATTAADAPGATANTARRFQSLTGDRPSPIARRSRNGPASALGFCYPAN
jgi:hypothetical protein